MRRRRSEGLSDDPKNVAQREARARKQGYPSYESMVADKAERAAQCQSSRYFSAYRRAQRSEAEAEADRIAAETQRMKYFCDDKLDRLLILGEKWSTETQMPAPCENAREEEASARMFAEALGMKGYVIAGETTLRTLLEAVHSEWQAQGIPLLNFFSGRFTTAWERVPNPPSLNTPLSECWTFFEPVEDYDKPLIPVVATAVAQLESFTNQGSPVALFQSVIPKV
jgi:hypothetical protein